MDPIVLAALAEAGLGFLGGLFSGGGDAGGDYTQDPGYQARAQYWAKGYAEEYPEFPGLPEQVGQMGTALTQMLSGELAPAVMKYLTSKYQQAWGQALPGLADIGAGPGTLASLQLQAGERQAVEGAYMGQQQITRGMEFMPQYTEMMLSPYMADVQKWGDIGGLRERQYPGAKSGKYWRGLQPGERSY